MTELPQDMRHALMHVAGVRLAKNAFMAVHAGPTTVWLEAHQKKKIWVPLKNPRRLMGSIVDRLIAEGYVEHKMDGSALLIYQTDKRP